MHVFEEYQAPSAAAVADLIGRHPFALVVSAAASVDGGPVPEGTHVPVIPAPDSDLSAGLEGATLWGHMATVNPQWRGFTAGARVLVVFTGPDGYVSPSTYGAGEAAPTWNYAAVHVVGRVRLVESPEETLAVITATVEALERDRPQPWDATGSLDYFQRILPGVRAFTVDVESVRAVFKMSQDKPAELRSRVREQFATEPGGGPAVATAMDASPPMGATEGTSQPT